LEPLAATSPMCAEISSLVAASTNTVTYSSATVSPRATASTASAKSTIESLIFVPLTQEKNHLLV
jgi:hypothetical protein